MGPGLVAPRRQPRKRPVEEHTDEGLPVREPGCAAGARRGGDGDDGRNGRNGGAHRRRGRTDGDDDSTFDTGPIAIPRDPEAVRSSIGNHFGGVHAGRSHARDSERRTRTDRNDPSDPA